MATDIVSLLAENWLMIAIFAVIIFVFYMLIKRAKKDEIPYKDFKPQPLKKTLKDELDDKLKKFGLDLPKGKMMKGFQRIAFIDKYLRVKGKFSNASWDYAKQILIVANSKLPDKLYDQYIFRAQHNNFIMRLLGFGKFFIFIKALEEGKPTFHIDTMNGVIMLPEETDMMSYGKVWANSEDAIEYLNDISVKRLLEQAQMHLENMPDKIVHLEAEQAKKDHSYKYATEQEKSKYKQREEAGDTTLT